MELIKAELNKDFSLAHYVSSNQEWEMGARSMLFGVRICGNRIGSEAFVFDYCAGADRGFIQVLVLVMMSILSSLPEATTERELEQMLPSYKTKPIDRDPCWPQLQQLAIGLTAAKLEESALDLAAAGSKPAQIL